MATYTGFVADNTGGNPWYQAIATFIFNALTTAGWVQTADTGQANPATIVTPGAVNSNNGYIIFGMNDALQATKPFYLKIFFGLGTPGTVYRYQAYLATGTDGAGNLTGNVSSVFSVTNVSVGFSLLIASGSTNRFTMSLWPDSNSGGVLSLNVERALDSAGAATTTGASICALHQSTVVGSQFIPATGSIPGVEAAMICDSSNVAIPNAGLGMTQFAPIRMANGPLTQPIIGWVAQRTNITASGAVSISLFGTARTYRVIPIPGVTVGGATFAPRGGNSWKLMMLWE